MTNGGKPEPMGYGSSCGRREYKDKALMKTRANAGFTLIELMIVVAIIGIIAAIAYPSYQGYVESTRRGDAKGALMQFASAMERYYTQNNTYIGADGGSSAINTTNTSPPASLFPDEAPLDGSAKFYDLYIYDLQANSFILRAVPKNGQAGDGFLQLRSNGVREWDADNSDSISGTEDTWSE
ncbi:MAG: type IV pilus assembly protein PilE [Marinobacter sp. T13-3]|nr:MAG: type IV pilus assembly protein PilE [Marinobacter sp. T13-3]